MSVKTESRRRQREERFPFAVHLVSGFLVVVLLKPIMVGQNGAVNTGFQILAIAVFLILILRSFVHRLTVSSTFMLLAGYRLVLLIPTITNQGDLAAWGYYTTVQLALLLMIESYAQSGRVYARGLLKVLANVLLIYLAINLVTVVGGYQEQSSWSNGFTQTTYFLGIRTRITDVVFPALLIARLCDLGDGKRLSVRTAAVFALGLWQVIYLGVATALVGFAVVLGVYWLFMIAPWAPKRLTMKSVTLGGVGLSAIFVLGRANENQFVASIVSGTLEKSLTLTGRTEIWVNALPFVKESLFLGHGVNHSFGAFVPWTAGQLWQAHSQYLQIAYDGGLVGVAVFVFFLLSASSKFDKAELPTKVRASVIAVYAAFAVMSVSEIFTYNMGVFFLLPFLASSIHSLGFGDDAQEPVELVGGKS